MINLRKLENKDADGIMEWMQDSEINRFFRFDNEKVSLDKIHQFIETSIISFLQKKCFHFAIADEMDEYLGTVSLKNVDMNNLNAEYAISLRKKAQGKGVAEQATSKVLNFAFVELGLQKVFLNVYSHNIRAIKFYEKMGFKCEGLAIKQVRKADEFLNLSWYAIQKEEFFEVKKRNEVE